MKLANVKVGMKVLVKDKDDSNFKDTNFTKIGIISDIDLECIALNVCVDFEDGEYDWGHYKDLKRVKEQSQ